MKELSKLIEIPPNKEMGDYSFPCFKLAKELRKSPIIIAQEINEKLEIDNELFEKVEVTGGYLNFFTNKLNLIQEVLKEIDNKKEEYGKISLWNIHHLI